jgi:hypothetical protein
LNNSGVIRLSTEVFRGVTYICNIQLLRRVKLVISALKRYARLGGLEGRKLADVSADTEFPYLNMLYWGRCSELAAGGVWVVTAANSTHLMHLE